MLFEAEKGNILMAITGETLISRGLTMYREERYLKMRELLRSADVTFTNAEVLFHNYEDPPAYWAGTYMRCDPRSIEDLQWLGINIVACANNHAYDFGENGVVTNIRYLDEAGLAHAGTGPDQASATAPTYLDTPNGRVALISATSPALNASAARAGERRRDMKGRPGANFIGYTSEWVVDAEAFGALRRISENLGWAQQVRRTADDGYSSTLRDSDTLIHLMDQTAAEASPARFALGESFGLRTYIDQDDLERNLQRVSDARRMADWVLFTIHNHEYGRTVQEPADHIKVLAHEVIDAGADVFIGHGPHEDRGIEIYKGKPILYSLGDFICQNDTVALQPHDNMVAQGLGWEATPSDFYDARSANGTRGQVVEPIRWQSAVAMVKFEGKRLSGMKLYPIDLGFGRPRSQQGRPLLAEGQVSAEVLRRFQTLSKPFGVEVAIDGEVGVVRVED